MQRVLIIGPNGAGKSTLAQHIGLALDLPVVHLDALFYLPNWVEPVRHHWNAQIQLLSEQKCWVIDGNYSDTLDIRLSACDTVIFLDFPRWLCLWRVLKRRIHYRHRARPDRAPECEERLTWSFLRRVWNYPRKRPQTLDKLSQLPPTKKVIILRTPSEVQAFVASLACRMPSAHNH